MEEYISEPNMRYLINARVMAANRLRNIATAYVPRMSTFNFPSSYVFRAAFGTNFYDAAPAGKCLDMLAGLIDPTCHVREYLDDTKVWVACCSFCGRTFSYSVSPEKLDHPDYCPKCGRRVIDGTEGQA